MKATCVGDFRRAARYGMILLLTACTDLTPPSPSALTEPASPQASVTLGDTTGLIAYWKLDEAPGATSFADASGSGITGSCAGSTCPSLGPWGKAATAARFTRANAQTITFGTPSQLDLGTSSFSYGFWAYVVGVPDSSTGSEVVWYKGGASPVDSGFDLEISAYGGGWNAGVSDGVTRRSVYGGTIYAQQWTHLMAVVDRTAGTLTLYENGSAVGAASLSGFGSVTGTRTAVLNCGPYGYCFDGFLDDVRIYYRALTATDVQALYDAYDKHYYVSSSGDSANPCTSSAPCLTMEQVSRRLAPGDTAHFAPGDYSWDGQVVSISGTASARVTYISDSTWSAKITNTGMYQGNPACGIIKNTGDYVDIVGFDMTGPCSNGLLQDGNYGRIIGNRVHDLPGTGGYGGILVDCCDYHLTGNEVIGNVVDNIGPFDGTNTIHGIYAAGPNTVIENNIVTRASATCIEAYHGATRLVISNNSVANCGRYGIEVGADSGMTNDYTTVDNNIVVNVHSDGDTAYGFGIRESYNTGCNNVYHNNIVYNNRVNFDLRSCVDSSGNVVLTPTQFNSLFVNYTGDRTGDYHLQSGALAAIDKGTTRCAPGVSICVPATDFDGYVRPYGIAYDIGAFEWHP